MHLDEAYSKSQLPDAPDQEPFREFLFRLRLRDLPDFEISNPGTW
jgi:hypothetical protein